MQEPETTTVHESRVAASPEAFQEPANHLFRKAYRQFTDAIQIQTPNQSVTYSNDPR